MRASQQDGRYPRPQLVREAWTSLDGPWDFAFDDRDEGRAGRWFTPSSGAFDRTVVVPFPPESPASGVGESGHHPVVWYRRTLPDDAVAAPPGRRLLVHFGAVDFRAEVWCDGHKVGDHVGGQTPFTADVTDALEPAGEHVLVVRAEDDPVDPDQPRGKQDWLERPHEIWYERTTGIWQSVWCETVAAQHLADLAWATDVAAATVHAEITLARPPARPVVAEIVLSLGDEVLAEQSVMLSQRTMTVPVAVAALRHGQHRRRLLWSPRAPVLVDAALRLRDRATGEVLDTVSSYLGLRTVGVGAGAFLLNERPFRMRAVLAQGYRPQTHLANSGSEQLAEEVRLAKRLGFNTVRVHQKAEDPRYLFWADRLGLLVWGETAAAYAWSPEAADLLTREWTALVRRDRSHPCVVVWVPVNESWGVQDLPNSEPQRRFVRGLADLTRAIDPTRPVLSNEGWEHVGSDILGVHDYTREPEVLAERYGGDGSAGVRAAAFGPAGRRLVLDAGTGAAAVGATGAEAPLMLTEFGGISMSDDPVGWGYATVSREEFGPRLRALFDAVRNAPDLAGFCYTQLMDTAQETNGLAFADGRPKLPAARLRSIVTGTGPPRRTSSDESGDGEDASAPEAG